eukprot:TRINITY_DN17618_c0_g1_i4.p1 TRINITY_DN17618_c0_g1~~TRINITY_DN17618_c0_g1_i4.p1  ORF type:complete len:491 (-),score=46.31 TRINITY_DN17618_c0_g1_i4:316-1788(-)
MMKLCRGCCCKPSVQPDGRSNIEETFYYAKEDFSTSEEGRSVYSTTNTYFYDAGSHKESDSQHGPRHHQVQHQQNRQTVSQERQSIWDWLYGLSPFGGQHGGFHEAYGEGEQDGVQQVEAVLMDDKEIEEDIAGRGSSVTLSACLQLFHPGNLLHHQHGASQQQQEHALGEISGGAQNSRQNSGGLRKLHHISSPKLQYGKTLFKLGDPESGREPRFCWCPGDPQSFRIRSAEYMKTRRKEPCKGSLYELVGVDLFSFKKKVFHIGKHIELPTLYKWKQWKDKELPPLIIINVMLPTYPAVLFGEKDGKGHSLVYYFALPDGFDPDKVDNQAAVNLLRKFIAGEHGHHFRDRLKLIPRIVNVDEWAKRGPLSQAELALLKRNNDKPVLTRPAHRFFRGDCYFEIDMDVHVYQFIARKAFQGYVGKLGEVVFENAFVVQGNNREELPELLIGCTRVFRVDFQKSYPLPLIKSQKNSIPDKAQPRSELESSV